MAKYRAIYGSPKKPNFFEENGDLSVEKATLNFHGLREYMMQKDQNAKLFDMAHSINKNTYTRPFTYKDVRDPIESLSEKKFFQKIIHSFTENNNTSKNQTGSEFIKNTQDLNDKIFMWRNKGKSLSFDPSKTMNAYEKILKNSYDKVMVFDFEGLSGKNMHNIMEHDHLSGFTFRLYDQKGAVISTYQSIIGISKDQAEELRKMMAEVKEKGYVTDKHRVISERLTIAGMSKNYLEKVKGLDGILRYSNQVSQEEARAMGHNEKVIEEGIQSLLEVGKQQQVIGSGMKNHEKVLLEALSKMTGDKTLITGFNITEYDFKALEALALSKESSPQFRNQALSLISQVKKEGNIFDQYNFIKILDPKNLELHGEEGLRNLKSMNLGTRTQEALIRLIDKDFYSDKVAHLDETDVEGSYELFKAIKSGKIGQYQLPTSSDEINKFKTSKAFQKGNVYKSSKGISPNLLDKHGILAFSKGRFGEGIDFAGQYKLDSKGKVIKDIETWFTKKGINYKIGSIKEIELSDEGIENFAKYSKASSTNKMGVIEFSPQLSRSARKTMKGRENPFYMVGPIEGLEAIINEGFSDKETDKKLIKHGKEMFLSDSAIRDLRKYNAKLTSEKVGIVRELKSGMTDSKNRENLLKEMAKINKEISDAVSENRVSDLKGLHKKIYELNNYLGKIGTLDNLLVQAPYLDKYGDALEYFKEASGDSKIHYAEYIKSLNEKVLKEEMPEVGNFFKLDLNKIIKQKKITLDDPERLLFNANLDEPSFIANNIYNLTQSTSKKPTDIEKLNILDSINKGLDKRIDESKFLSKLEKESIKKGITRNVRDASIEISEKMKIMKGLGLEDGAIPKYTLDLSEVLDGTEIRIDQSKKDIAKIKMSGIDKKDFDNIFGRLTQSWEKKTKYFSSEKPLILQNIAEKLIEEDRFLSESEKLDTVEKLKEIESNELKKIIKKHIPRSGKTVFEQKKEFYNIAKENLPDITEDDYKNIVNEVDESLPLKKGNYKFLSGKDEKGADLIEAALRDVLFNEEKLLKDEKIALKEGSIERNMQLVRGRDTYNLIEDLSKGLYKTGTNIVIQDGRIIAITKSGQEIDITLAQEVYEGGMFKTRIGQQTVSSSVGFFGRPAKGVVKGKEFTSQKFIVDKLYQSKKIPGDLRLQSAIGVAHRAAGSAEYKFVQAQKKGNLPEVIDNYIKSFGEVIRQAPDVSRSDAQDVKEMSSFILKDLMGNLGKLVEKGEIEEDDLLFGVREKNKKAIRKIIAIKPERLKISLAGPLKEEEQTILKNIVDNIDWIRDAEIGKTTFGEVFQGLGGTKKDEDFKRSFHKSKEMAAQTGTLDVRLVTEQESRSAKFTKSPDESISWRYGKNISSLDRLNKTTIKNDKYLGNMESYYKLRELDISDKALRNIVNEMAAEGFNEEITEELYRMHTESGAAFMRESEYNKMIQKRSTEQRINTLSLLDLADEASDEAKLRKAAGFKIVIEKDEVKFVYPGNEKIIEVKKGQEILTKRGVEGARQKAVEAKYDGYLKLGIFDRGTQIRLEEDKVSSFLKGAESTEDALTRLYKEFDVKYFIDPKNMERHEKFFRGLEKKMVWAVSDDTVDALQNKLGLDYLDVITSSAKDAKKHGDIEEVIQTLTGRMYEAKIRSGESLEKIPESIRQELGAIFGDGKVGVRDGKLHYEDIDIMNNEAIRALREKYEGKGYGTTLQAYGVSSTHVDVLHRDKIKITDRHRLVMDTLRKEEAYLSKMESHFKDSGIDVRKAYERFDEGENVLNPVIKSLNRDLRTYGDSPYESIMIIKKGDVVDQTKNAKRYRKFKQLISEAGLEDAYKQIVSGKDSTFRHFGIEEASIESLARYNELRTAEKATQWNAMKFSMDKMEEIKEYGFKNAKIEDMIYDIKAGEDTIFNKAYMVDLEVANLGKHQIYDTLDDRSRYLALPYFKADYYSEREAKTTVQQKVSALQSSIRRFNEEIREGKSGFKEEDLIKKSSFFKAQLNEIYEEIGKYSGKGKQLGESSTSILLGSRKSASGHLMYGGESSKFLSGLKFNEKSVLGLAEKGIDIDYVFAGEDHFKEYLSDKYLREIGKSKNEMLDYLRTEGATELLIREPQDYTKSTRFSKVYLDDTIKDSNIMRVSAVTTAAIGGDYDSDFFSLGRFNALATITKDGKSKKERIDYLQYNILKGQEGVLIDEKSTKLFEGIEASMFETAYMNKAYRSALENTELTLEMAHDSIMNRHKFLDQQGNILSRDEAFKNMDLKARSRAMQNFETINKNLGLDHRKLLSEGIYSDEINKALEGGINLDEAIKGTAGLSSSEDAVRKTIIQGVYLEQEFLKSAAKQTKLGAGEANFLLYGMRQSANLAREKGVITNEEMLSLVQTNLAFQEFSLAGKSAAQIDYEMIEKVGYAYKDPSKLRNLIESTIYSRSELDEITGVSKDEAIGLTESAIRKINKSPLADDFLRQTTTAMGMQGSSLVTSGKEMTYADFWINMMHHESQKRNIQSITKTDLMRQVLGSAEYDMKTTSKAASGVSLSGVLESVHDITKNKLTGKNLAFSALGLAGAVMVAGFVGGNPLEPSTRQAEKQSENMYQISPSMADQQMMPGQGGQQGYIININADTRSGRRHAETAIRDAVAMTQQSSNVNISMNVRDSWGNISDRDMQTRIRRMF